VHLVVVGLSLSRRRSRVRLRPPRCHSRPGYRIYFAKADTAIVLLLVGGDKASQRRDIRQARRFWGEYQEATHHGTT
jgi:putative addiction module killer protein